MEIGGTHYESTFVWLVAGGWCLFVLREKYCWLVGGCWFVLREKYCWLVADKPNEHETVSLAVESSGRLGRCSPTTFAV
jgi:hypothetical protein